MREESLGENNSIVICRHCGHDLFDPQDIFSFESPGSLQTKNNTVIGSVRSNVQLLQNPHGYQFEVVTVRHSICAPQGTWHSSHSWFPGYSWKICLCPTCHTHIGWIFKKVKPSEEDTTNNSFFGLILDRILEESSISQLLVTPKSYRV
ncbi:protein cereblon-like isoform X2 [Amphibalanus amphitrite]|uniref:protein cereblon-like isoform X2 n=1 Tax=Amphibalanus amphitrite TaxID=1232801 RepID=UPI001C901775|nr:protein cereblon-like isoform X2 [Amphibalanus amphitrite]XP_043218123.1 protein cereblon-like isoform X2 [Amphibalanus amphitrite]